MRGWKLGLAVAACAMYSCSPKPQTPLIVSAAASLQKAMPEVAAIFPGGVKLEFNYGASGMLAQQVENGAPADVLLSAAPGPMDELEKKDLILPGTRHDLLRNEVVLIAPKDAGDLDSFQDLAGPKVKLFALGDPASVPAGDYGRQVLRSLGVWDAVQQKLVLAKDVTQVLTYVETGNAEAGIVYATDAAGSAKVRVAATAAAGTHQPVVYPVAVLRHSAHPAEAREFVAFLRGRQAGGVFIRHGFTVVQP